MAVDRRARVTIEITDEDHHIVSAPGFCSSVGRFKCRDGNLEWLEGEDDFRLVDAVWSTANAMTHTNLSLVLDTNEFIDEDCDTKIGIGSSAALVVALASALFEIAVADEDATGVAFAAHRRFQGGYGSGIDVACSCAGGLIEYRMSDARSQRLSWPDGLVHAVLWSGVVARTGGKLEQLERQAAQPSRAALVNTARRMAGAWRDGSAQAILEEYRDYTTVLREFSVDHELGIFDAGHAELADAADAAGLVYKPCGAGGGDVGIALADDAAAIRAFVGDAVSQNVRVLNMNIDPHGVQTTRERR
jgi:phosphomevalonate kinase